MTARNTPNLRLVHSADPESHERSPSLFVSMLTLNLITWVSLFAVLAWAYRGAPRL
jgi:hypothetical protein